MSSDSQVTAKRFCRFFPWQGRTKFELVYISRPPRPSASLPPTFSSLADEVIGERFSVVQPAVGPLPEAPNLR